MGGGSTKSQSVTDPESQKTTKLVRESVLNPLINEFMPQWIQALMGKPNKMPVVQSQKAAMKVPTEQLDSNIAKAGLTGTPYGDRMINEAESTAAKGQASVGPDMMMELFKQVPGMITGTSQNIIGLGKGTGGMTGKTNDGGAGAAQLGTSLASAAMMAWSYY